MEYPLRDIQLCILDHIQCPEDLKSLCLLSKHWYPVARSRLWGRIVLDVDTIPRFSRFVENERLTAHLHSLRDLTILDNSGVPRRAEAYLSTLFDVIPDDILRSFRFLGGIDTPAERHIHDLLRRRQKKLRSLHTDFYWSHRFFAPEVSEEEDRKEGVLALVEEIPLRTLNLKTRCSFRELDRLVQLISCHSQNLRRLCLHRPYYWEFDSDESPATPFQPSVQPLPNLKEFALIDLDPTLHGIAGLVDFQTLTHLTCRGRPCYDRKMLETLFGTSDGKEFSLIHLALTLQRSPPDFDTEQFELSTFLDLCPELQSLHFYWEEDNREGSEMYMDVVHWITKNGSKLRSLGLGMYVEDLNAEDAEKELKDLSQLCNTCPNLQQLCFGMDASLLVVSAQRLEKFRPANLRPFSYLFDNDNQIPFLAPVPDLRTLHIILYRSNMCDYPRHNVEAMLRYFASHIFRSVTDSGFCPKLNAIAFGINMRNYDRSDPLVCRSRYFFLRGDGKDLAHQVSLAHLRHVQPISDSLAYGFDDREGLNYFFDWTD